LRITEEGEYGLAAAFGLDRAGFSIHRRGRRSAAGIGQLASHQLIDSPFQVAA
jgi:hypothetical protein